MPWSQRKSSIAQHHKHEGWDVKALTRLYRTCLLSRKIDDAEIALKRHNRIYFQISGAGHEVSLAVAAEFLVGGHDWFFPYYRDRALCLALGVTPVELFMQAAGAKACPASGGRQMPNHWSHPAYNIVSEASTTGTQYLTAVGCAEVCQTRNTAKSQGLNEIVYCSSGEGATSQGVFFEALNTACMKKLPIVFHIEDNGWAISTPVSQQTAGGSISKLVSGFAGLLRIEFDGCCVEDSRRAWSQGTAYARAQMGPVLLHAHVVRPYSHSLSDDERLYRNAAELDAQERRDPLPRLRRRLLDRMALHKSADAAAQLGVMEATLAAQVAQAAEEALALPPPNKASAAFYVYSPNVDPTGQAFDRPHRPVGCDEPSDTTMVDLINRCLQDEMQRNENIVVFGEDVADVPEDGADALRGKGGVFKVTHGLQRRFGRDRVFNTPLAEANIIGRATGMALRGLKPVVEIQFFDYIWPAMMQIRSEVALLRWRSNNAWKCPMVIRAAYGGYLKGGSIFHSQTGESTFLQIPGLRVVLPSNATDANGLLRTAIRCDDPVLFLEHKHLYRQTYNRGPNPGDEFMIPFGKAKTVLAGDDLSIVTYGALVKRSLDAVDVLRADGKSIEVIDLRTLSPYDWPAIVASVKKTGRVLVVHEEGRSWGFGAEIAARIAEELFDWLDAPPSRLGAMDTFVGYHPNLEEAILPQVDDIIQAARALI